jgi:hypothetical protein
MRIWRHHERDDTPTRPAWSADKPVWSDVHIAAPQARELVAEAHDEHLPHAAA